MGEIVGALEAFAGLTIGIFAILASASALQEWLERSAERETPRIVRPEIPLVRVRRRPAGRRPMPADTPPAPDEFPRAS
jgi:hypothetical protein